MACMVHVLWLGYVRLYRTVGCDVCFKHGVAMKLWGFIYRNTFDKKDYAIRIHGTYEEAMTHVNNLYDMGVALRQGEKVEEIIEWREETLQ